MDLKKTTVRGLFNSDIQFTIPVYQRAYSWRSENWDVFLEDLLQQVEKENGYSFGNVLLETIQEDVEYEVIDGQQRLTTIVIFMRSLYNILKKNSYPTNELELIERYFLKDRGRIKLRPVEHDRACFDSVIINDISYSTSSFSQECIINAKKHFEDKLDRFGVEKLESLKDLVLSSKINRIELEGKKEAALMFELQNNRGRDLTNMEKLKSFFMYQMYVNSASIDTNTNVDTVSNFFKDIYRLIYDIKNLDEDSILRYHCQAYLRVSFNFDGLEDIKKELTATNDRITWITDFCRNLALTFSNMKRMNDNNGYYFKKLKQLCEKRFPAFVYPFIIKGYKYLGDDPDRLDVLFHILEILTFRYELIPSRAYFNSRIDFSLKSFNGDLDLLKKNIHSKINEEWHWCDSRAKDILNGQMYNNSVLHYLLWEYEEFIQRPGYKRGSIVIENEQIEHISPQTEPNEAIAAGYDVDESNHYSDEFHNKYLNCLGNLMLISGSHNSSIGNKPFTSKLDSYNTNPLLNQQAEIKTFIDTPVVEWKTKNIQKRHQKIVAFAIDRWDFDNV